MDQTDNIRSMSVIAHVDHGKSINCDCELILDTVLELDEVLTPFECEHLIASACRKAEERGGFWGEMDVRKVGRGDYMTEDIKIADIGSERAQRIFKEKVKGPLTEIIAEHYELPAKTISV